MTTKEEREQRIDDACDNIEAILRSLPPGEGEKALVDVCAGYLLATAYAQCGRDRRLVPIKEGAYALAAFKEKVNDKMVETISEDIRKIALQRAEVKQ